MSNWLHISPTTGRGSTQMTISADTNKTGYPRKAKIIVTAGTMTRTIDVLQTPSEADIVITYVVDSSTVKLLSSIWTYPCEHQFVLSTATSAITDVNPTAATDYSQSLGLQSGDTLTLSIFSNCLGTGYTQIKMTEPEIPATSIAFNKHFRTQNTGYEFGNCIAHLPKLETVYISAEDCNGDGDEFHGAWFYDCPKLREFTGENRVILNSRTLAYRVHNTSFDYTYLIGFAGAGAERYEIPDNIDIIGQRAFQFTTATTSQSPLTVKEVVIPENVKIFDAYNPAGGGNPGFTATTDASWFLNFDSLTSVTVPSTITTNLGTFAVQGQYANFAFQGCTGLTNAVVNLGQAAGGVFVMNGFFKDCISLSSVTFGSGFAQFDDNFFEGCTALTAFTIPDSISIMKSDVFTGCTSLTSMTVTDILVPSATQTTFRGIAENGVLTYPTDVTGYTRWLSTNQYYLGYYGWTDAGGEEFEAQLSTYSLYYLPNTSGVGSSQSVFITTNSIDYQIVLTQIQGVIDGSSSVDWMVVSGTPDVGYTEFKVYPTSTTSGQRNCYMCVVHDNRIYGTVAISQGVGGNIIITLSKTYVVFNSEQDTNDVRDIVEINVSSNVDYVVSCDQTNFIVRSYTGSTSPHPIAPGSTVPSGDTILRVYPKSQNYSGSNRLMYIYFTYEGTTYASILVEQLTTWHYGGDISYKLYNNKEESIKITPQGYSYFSNDNLDTITPKKVLINGEEIGYTDWYTVPTSRTIKLDFFYDVSISGRAMSMPVTTYRFDLMEMAYVGFYRQQMIKYIRIVDKVTNLSTNFGGELTELTKIELGRCVSAFTTTNYDDYGFGYTPKLNSITGAGSSRSLLISNDYKKIEYNGNIYAVALASPSGSYGNEYFNLGTCKAQLSREVYVSSSSLVMSGDSTVKKLTVGSANDNPICNWTALTGITGNNISSLSGCTSLVEAKLGTTVRADFFSGCTALTSVTLTDGCNLGYHGFNGFTAPTIKITGDINNIVNDAFSGIRTGGTIYYTSNLSSSKLSTLQNDSNLSTWSFVRNNNLT